MPLRRLGAIGLGLILLALSFGFGTEVSQTNAAFGTSPPWVRNDHLLPGTTFEQIINLSRSDADQDMRVNLRYDGNEELLKWMKVENESKLIFPKGDTIFPMNVIIKVPKRATLGDYKGGIFVTLESIQEEGGGPGGTVAIRLGSHVTVEVSVVGEAFTDYTVKSISSLVLNENEPFAFNIELINLGNTEITEVDGQVDIYNSDETEIVRTLSFSDLSEPVGSSSGQAVKMIFENVSLNKGSYWLHVRAFKDDEVIYENRLNQTVLGPVVPIITAEDLQLESRRPQLPTPEQNEVLTETADVSDTRPAAAESGPTIYLWLAVIGVGFGVIALISVVVILIVVVRRQQQAAVQQYLARKDMKL